MKKNRQYLMKISLLFLLGWSHGVFAQNGQGEQLPSLGDDEFNQLWETREESIELDYGLVNEAQDYQKLNILTLDTRRKEECVAVVREVNKSGNLNQDEQEVCRYIADKPFVSIVGMAQKNEAEGLTVRYSELSDKEKLLVKQTRNFLVPATAIMGVIYALPKEITHWEKFVPSEMFDRYIKHINAGPVIDKDRPIINYVGHPYSGAIYYVTARHAGFSPGVSFGYSAFMSTVFWDYGLEGFQEIPSIQDLIVTPVLGSLLGEMMLTAEKKLKANDGVLLGSKALGSVGLTLLNPAEAILKKSDALFGKGQFIKDSEGYLRLAPSDMGDSMEFKWGVLLKF
jgi:hypothetical protein